MENSIFDYLAYYKNSSFDEVKFNMIDALLYSIIAYVPVTELRDNSSLKTLNSITTNMKSSGTMATLAINVIRVMADSIRYKDVRLYRLVKEYNETLEFGALTFRDNNYTFIGFQGSIGTMAGWRENLYLTINFPTASQDRSVKYVKEVVRLKDRNLYIGGHSKGGNLALASLLLAPRYVARRVVKVYNFDGPGFRNEEVKSEKYKELKDKMVNILPDGSVIGMLLQHEEYHFIKSRSISIEKHFPNNWAVFGQFFVEGEETKSSKAFDNKVELGLSKLTYEERKQFIDTIFEFMKEKKISSLKDISKLDIEDIKGIISSMKNLSSDKKKIVLDTAKAFIKSK